MNLQLLCNLEELKEQISNLQRANACTQNIDQGANNEKPPIKGRCVLDKWRAREDSNPQPSDP